MDNPLDNAESYERYVYSIQQRHPRIRVSTLVLKRSGKLFGELSGQPFFEGAIRIFVKERLDSKNSTGMIHRHIPVTRPSRAPTRITNIFLRT